MSLSITPLQVPFPKPLSSPAPLFLSPDKLSLTTIPRKTTIIRMGGGPRTYPGGVSKWQWKRMQAKKAKQLLKARLCRERQIYEMRKRAELKAAVSELERPWEVVEKAPNLFSVNADEQVKVLADRFQRPGGFDLWSDRDGPQIFKTYDGVPSARFFPKGVVHSVKPYGKIEMDSLGSENDDESKHNDGQREGHDYSNERKDNREIRTMKRGKRIGLRSTLDPRGGRLDRKQRGAGGGEERGPVHDCGGSDGGRLSRIRGLRKSRDLGRGGSNGERVSGTRELRNSSDMGHGGSDDGRVSKSRGLRNLIDSGRRSDDDSVSRSAGSWTSRNSGGEVYEMSVQRDGSYGFQEKNEHYGIVE